MAKADKSGIVNSFDEVSDFYAEEFVSREGITTDMNIRMKEGSVNSSQTTHEVNHTLGNDHTTQPDGTLTEGLGVSSVSSKNISETLMGVGIGGNTVKGIKTLELAMENFYPAQIIKDQGQGK